MCGLVECSESPGHYQCKVSHRSPFSNEKNFLDQLKSQGFLELKDALNDAKCKAAGVRDIYGLVHYQPSQIFFKPDGGMYGDGEYLGVNFDRSE